ncbi:MAG: gliding motility-associated C-terminal domain-containing protein [Bacteroidales bacterium]|nr:gliding motility-associated C-terminal domain-containing protein [Bacteroidales bacterium]
MVVAKTALKKIGLTLTCFTVLSAALNAQQEVIYAGEDIEMCFGQQAKLKASVKIPTDKYNPVYFDDNDLVLNQVFEIPFTFEFFGIKVDKFVISPNGWISFNPDLAGSFSDCNATAIPSTDPSVPKNAIMFPWQDWYPRTDDGSYIGWAVLGSYPETRLIVNFFNVKLEASQDLPLTLIKLITSGKVYDKVGDVVQYSFIITNSGNHTLPGPFTVIDNMIGTLTDCAQGPLEPDATVICSGQYTITQKDLDNGSVTNYAFATTEDGNMIISSNIDTETARSSLSPQLTLKKQIVSGNPYSKIGDVIIYGYEIINTGLITLEGPFTVVDDKIGTLTNCAAGPLAPNETRYCTGSYTITQADLEQGSVTNIAYVTTHHGTALIISNAEIETATAMIEKRGTFQLILYEGSHELADSIDIHITAKPSSGSYLHNRATIGVHDRDGLKGVAPDCCNGTSWTTEHESWRFKPKDPPPEFTYTVEPIDFNPEIIGEISEVKWYENTIDPEHYLSTGYTLTENPTDTTSYIAQILVNGTVPYSDTAIVYVNPLPVANAGDDITITSGDPVTLDGSKSSGIQPLIYYWQSADGSWLFTGQSPQVQVIPAPTTTTEYILQVTDANGCKSDINTEEAHVIVRVNSAPLFVTLSANHTTICKGDEVVLTAKVLDGSPPYQPQWEALPPVVGWDPNPLEYQQCVYPLSLTTFTVTVTDEDGTIKSATTTVDVISVQPEIKGETEVCEKETGVIYTTDPTGNHFSWSMTGPGDINPLPGDYMSEVDFGAGSGTNTINVIETNDQYQCIGTASLTVTIHPKPNPVIDDTKGNPVCQWATGVPYSVAYDPKHTYIWNLSPQYGNIVLDNDFPNQVKIDWIKSGEIPLTLTESTEHCENKASVFIKINPAPTPEIRNEDGISGQEEICENTTRTYTTPGSPDHTYSWNTVPVALGDEISNPLLNEKTFHWKKEGATSLIVTETNETNCTATSEPFTVIIHPNPVLSLFAESLSVCRGDSALIELNGGDDYDWIEGQDITWITETSSWWLYPGENMHYLIRGTDESTGCSDTLSWDVEIRPNPVVELGDDKYLSPGQTLYLEPGGDFDEYIWFNDDFSEILSYSKILDVTSVGLYHLEVGLKGCTAQDSIWIKMPAGLLPIPNAFTPNSDGENDTFGLVGSLEEITRFNMQIFNRWGALLYETNDPSQPWDGTFNGILCDTGTYVWIISLEEKSSGQNTTNRGFVALLR